MKKLLLLTAVVASLLCACHKDDDKGSTSDPVPDSKAQHSNIMVVFAPGQLGDQGYADRVMLGANSICNSSGTADSPDVEFISTFDSESTRELLKGWVSNRNSLISGEPYGRRLLILTELYMAPWLMPLKDSLGPNDELLLLKSNAKDVAQASEALGMEGRVHGLNISAAGAIKLYCKLFMQFTDENKSDELQRIGIIRLYNDSITPYRDSIAETVEAITSKDLRSEVSVMQDRGLYAPEDMMSASERIYDFCTISRETFKVLGYHGVFLMMDFGASNSAADFYLLKHNGDNFQRALILDAEPQKDLHRYAITRHFDRALSEWITEWLHNPSGQMPSITTHGEWDGYCTNDIDSNTFLQTNE